MSKKISLLISLFLLVLGNAFSSVPMAHWELSGIAKDSLTGEGLPYANVQVWSLDGAKLLKGATTDIDGNYLIKGVMAGQYRLIASYMGYHDAEMTINIQVKKEIIDLLLAQKRHFLTEVEVSAEKSLVEQNIEKTTINVTKNTTLTGGTAIDVIQTLPSVDIDIDGNINYRGSDKVIILINGEKSQLIKSLDQIPADRIQKIELINNPSAQYDAEGMSGIINIVLKSGKSKQKNKTTLMLSAGLPETYAGNIGYSGTKGKIRFFFNAGLNHKTKFQTKEHVRKNYENPNAVNYYQYDYQDAKINSTFLSTSLKYVINKKQQIGFSIFGTKRFNTADRKINYETQNEAGNPEQKSLKNIDIALDNYAIDGNLHYRYSFKRKGQFAKANLHYSLFDQLQKMDNQYYPSLETDVPDWQNTYSEQKNNVANFTLHYAHPLTDSILLESGYSLSDKNLQNDFLTEVFDYHTSNWTAEPENTNKFRYIQQIHAAYLSVKAQLRRLEIQAGIRGELTNISLDNHPKKEYFDFFPSISISSKLNTNHTIFASFNRRINRPTIKMLNPFPGEYADIMNRHIGNPNLKPEYVNSVETGVRFIYNQFSGSTSIYFRDINQAISSMKFASNDSALVKSYVNLAETKLVGGELAISYQPFKWWSINTSANLFQTKLNGVFGYNQIDRTQTAWNVSISSKYKLPRGFGIQWAGYYKSKLPSVNGTYIHRYNLDIAINKKILQKKGQLIFKISDVFNSYFYGLDLDAVDDNNYHYSQYNRRKNESQYFILSFIYNIDGKKKKKKKGKFFLDDFGK